MRRMLVCFALLLSCSGSSERPLTIFGAASLQDVLQEAATDFESPVDLRFNFAGSNELARQLAAGAHADVFVSADEQEMSYLVEEGIVEAHRVERFLSNRLALIRYAGEERANERLMVAGPSVPAGRYAREWWNAIGDSLDGEPPADCPLVSALDVRAALQGVASGAIGYGIVYRSDALSSDLVEVLRVQGEAEPPVVHYPAVVLGASERPKLAAEFLRFLAEQRDLFAEHGFSVAN